jgi:Transcriptional regulator containing an amidase domain and an AraC-type DNA-binding HTH domain
MSDRSDTIIKTIAYIYDNLDGELRLETLAQRAGYSSDHFNRIFRFETSESVHAFILRVRLERAASRLIKSPNLSLAEIAAEAGYSASNFAVAFKARFGRSPSEFRRAPSLNSYDLDGERAADLVASRRSMNEERLRAMDEESELRRFDERLLFRERYVGRYLDLGSAWSAFCARNAPKALDPEEPEWYGISYDDPFVTEQGRCSYDICLRVAEGGAASLSRSGSRYLRLPEGLYACRSFSGPVRELYRIYDELLAFWMPARGLKPSGGPPLERYLSECRPDGFFDMLVSAPVL